MCVMFRGWGLRCLDDIPAGGFICVYAGQILTEQGANEVSVTFTFINVSIQSVFFTSNFNTVTRLRETICNVIDIGWTAVW